MKLENLSKSIVDIMIQLAKNEGLARLLVNNEKNPFLQPVEDKSNLIAREHPDSKIHPFPFDPDAITSDSSFVRVYHNDGEFDGSEVILETQLLIDIVVAKSLWLIDDGERSLIRPYEIMGRIIDQIGSRSLNTTIKLDIKGFRHLAVNTKFDAIRLYCEYLSIEA
ncbi:hypothetical protein Q7A53_06170 [Halobacillus rhizosphaerae]|uniref:hypothetical protein n=1 Tax=Halobacillus rhizosphaerae TaxID=3064889 RepID=UPI00398BBA3D